MQEYEHKEYLLRNNAVFIIKYRSSDITDYQWCMEHHIEPGTFYN